MLVEFGMTKTDQQRATKRQGVFQARLGNLRAYDVTLAPRACRCDQIISW